jgi:hypothetical protein
MARDAGPSDPENATAARLREAAGPLAAEAVARMSDRFSWFRNLPPEQRTWVALVAQSGVREFLHWLSAPEGRRADARALAGLVFGDAPPEMARAVSLEQTVELVRLTVAVVEEHAPELAAPAGRPALREAVLVFSRDVAFATAAVYARAAEQRGAWDARLESLAVDHVLRDEPADLVVSRAAALGWGTPAAVTVLVGSAAGRDVEAVVAAVHQVAARVNIAVLAGVQGDQLAVVAGLPAGTSLEAAAHSLTHAFGPGPVVYGDLASTLATAGASARAALSGAHVAAGWPELARPAPASALLPERALAGDESARAQLVQDFYNILDKHGNDLLATIATFLELGGSLEATGRTMFIHANTVRYRLRRATQLTGIPLSTPRGQYVARIALTLGRLEGQLPSSAPSL